MGFNIKYLVLLLLLYVIFKLIYKWRKRKLFNKSKKNNVVVLGLSRTGTSSMMKALKILGYNSWHFTHLSPDTLDKLGYNAIGDLPNLRRKFSINDIKSNTKYILTTRNSKDWLESMRKWIYNIWNIDIDYPNKRRTFLNKNYSFGESIFKKSPVNYINNLVHNIEYEYPEIKKQNLEKVMLSHEEKIKNMFNLSGNRNKLLVFDVTDKKISSNKKWNILCNFLNEKDKPIIEFPKENYDSLYWEQIKDLL